MTLHFSEVKLLKNSFGWRSGKVGGWKIMREWKTLLFG